VAFNTNNLIVPVGCIIVFHRLILFSIVYHKLTKSEQTNIFVF